LAGAVTSFINILDPEVVIIGGGIARAGDALFNRLPGSSNPSMASRRAPGENRAGRWAFAGAFGAAYNALQAPE
jgi:predicted NBD/HSP70 family sugar kinase